jgi:hypothetical protein
MKRLLYFLIIFATLLTTALVASRSVLASPDRKGTSVLTGVVIGPNDRPVARAAVINRLAEMPHTPCTPTLMEDLQFQNFQRTTTTCALPQTEFSPSGRKTSPSTMARPEA